MRVPPVRFPRGYTLLEVMLAMALLALIVSAIYSTWVGIMKASKVGLNAAVQAQRERTAMHVIEEALTAAQLFVANPDYYSFAPENEGKTTLSFTAYLPEDFPRSGRYSAWPMRRVIFSLENGGDGEKQLVLRQYPILMEMSDDEKVKPVVLARDVKKFKLRFWDNQEHEYKEEWLLTNQLPQKVEVSLQLNYPGVRTETTEPLLRTEVIMTSLGVQPSLQAAQAGAPGTPGAPGAPRGLPIHP
jgi:type II secretion system protein J